MLYLFLGKYGGLSKGSWNGMIRDVIDGKADIAVQGDIPTTLFAA